MFADAVAVGAVEFTSPHTAEEFVFDVLDNEAAPVVVSLKSRPEVWENVKRSASSYLHGNSPMGNADVLIEVMAEGVERVLPQSR
jgi:hypothetical protein